MRSRASPRGSPIRSSGRSRWRGSTSACGRVAAALVLLNYVLAIVLGVTLTGFGENSRAVAVLLAQVVLAPLFFLGLSILYFEQKARAVSSRPRTEKGA